MKKYLFAFALLLGGVLFATANLLPDDNDVVKKFIKIRIKETGEVKEVLLEDVDSIYFEDSLIHTPVVKEVKFDKNEITLEEDQTAQLTYSVEEKDAEYKIDTIISDTKIVKYAGNTVIALAPGEATIIVKADDVHADTCTVTVTAKPTKEVSDVIIVDNSRTADEYGDKIYIKAAIIPTDAEPKSVSWTSSNIDVVQVAKDVDNPLLCAITPKKAGTATVTVTIDGIITTSCTVIVESETPPTPQDVKVTGISVSRSSMSLLVGSKSSLSFTISPSNATNKSVKWSSNNEKVATVSTGGVVTAVSKGTATITVTSEDGNNSALCSVTVNEPEPEPEPVSVTGVSISKQSADVDAGSTISLQAYVIPSNATNTSVTWSSSNATIASVSAYGVVSGKKAGDVVITATTVDGGFLAQCNVHVTILPPSFSNVEDATVTATTATANVRLSGYVGDITEAGLQWSKSRSFLKDESTCVPGGFRTTSNSYTTTIEQLESSTTYYFRAYFVQQQDTTYSEESRIFTTRSSDPFPVAELVDLELPSGLLWSSWNLGAQAPGEVGGYYCWGDATGEATSLQNYVNPGSAVENISGNAQYDIATAQWGPNWRTPYYSEYVELFENCTEEYFADFFGDGSNVQVKKLISKKNPNKFIYIPRGGSMSGETLSKYGTAGFYWTAESYEPTKAERTTFCFSTYGSYWKSAVHGSYRMNIRPVSGKYVPPKTEEDLRREDVAGETSQAGTAVDLGLSVRWASCNVGASNKSASDAGGYFAWGETTSGKSQYNEYDYKHVTETGSIKDIGNSISGTEYDAATVNWGGKWRMPSEDEFLELHDKCEWVWTTENGVNGYRIYGVGEYSNNSIFLPVTGFISNKFVTGEGKGHYWTSSVYSNERRPQYIVTAWYATFTDDGKLDLSYFTRTVGKCIRPVKPLFGQ